MKISKSFLREMLFVFMLSLFCFIFPLAVFSFKMIVFYTADCYDLPVKCYYAASGLFFVGMIYALLLWRGRNKLFPHRFQFILSYLLLHFFCFVSYPVLLIAFHKFNFKNGFEGVGFSLVLLGTAFYILFLDALALLLLVASFLIRKYAVRSFKTWWIILCIPLYALCAFLCVWSALCLYAGLYAVAIPGILMLYTLLSCTLPSCEQKQLETH